jgi:protein SCO1/2
VIADRRLTDSQPPNVQQEVKIGGPFTLSDHTGRQATEQDFRGKYMLIFFGYTFCPDVCPTSLTEISAAMDKLGTDAAKVVPILVTIDPERDTAEVLKDYVGHFHPSVVGLTGTPEQIKQIAKSYRVYYAKVPDEGGDKDAYLMDHSSVIYLMGPDGKFMAHFNHQTDAETMAAKIKSLL